MLRDYNVFKFVIIGDGGIGKTTLTKVFCNNPYIDQIMTIGIDIHSKDVVINDQKTVLQIWDVSGQSQFKFLIPDFVLGANGVILAYAQTRPESFINLDYWLNIIRIHANSAPIILISTKSDKERHPALTPEMSMKYVERNNLIGFIETSAKLLVNVNLPFKRLLEHIYNLKPDTCPIKFLGIEEKSKLSTVTESSIISPSEKNLQSERPQLNHPLQEITSNKENPRISSSLNSCKFCNLRLRPAQIKLKQMGQKVLCHNCLKLT